MTAKRNAVSTQQEDGIQKGHVLITHHFGEVLVRSVKKDRVTGERVVEAQSRDGTLISLSTAYAARLAVAGYGA